MLSPEDLFRTCAYEGMITRPTFACAIEKLTTDQFNYFCNCILASYEFMIKYEGKCLTENERIKNIYALPIVKNEFKHYNPQYVNSFLTPIDSPVSIIAAILSETGYDKERFLRYVRSITTETFATFCEEVRNLEYFQATQIGNGLIDCSIAEDVCEGLWWKVDYSSYKPKA